MSECGQQVIGFQGLTAHPPDQRAQDPFIACKIARIADGPPADAGDRETETAAFVGERLHA